MIRKLVLLILLLLPFLHTKATHNRAGEIVVRCIDYATLEYEVMIITYTKTNSDADRDELIINWGENNDLDTLPRVNGIQDPGTGRFQGEPLANNIKKNVYVGRHIYGQSGEYIVSMYDPNRVEDILNIPNSVDIAFYIETKINTGFVVGENNTPELLNPPIDDACFDKPFIHNPGAYDIEGDSLSYELVSTMTKYSDVQAAIEIPGYHIPNGVSINPVTGDLLWDSPQLIGHYNFTIKITEWRDGRQIGYMLRDLQVTVKNCEGEPPLIETEESVCVEAGKKLVHPINVYEYDTITTDIIASFEYQGGPFNTVSGAIIDTVYSDPSDGDSLYLNLIWNTECLHVRKQPYLIVLKATDNSEFKLYDMQTMQITVVGPAPENPEATTNGNELVLSWDRSVCNQVVGYKVYRRKGLSGIILDTCITGVPEWTGYELIGTTDDIDATTFTDDNGGAGLASGVEYCYRVTAVFPDDVEGRASIEFCGLLEKELPILTHVDVRETDPSVGEIYVQWAKPSDINMDTHNGPFIYELYRREYGSGQAFDQVTGFTGATDDDTLYLDSGLDTETKQWEYEVHLINNEPGNVYEIGSSAPASSIFTSLKGNDKQMIVSWQEDVAWSNLRYVVFREDPVNSENFISLDTVLTNQYVDNGLENNQLYGYKILGIGSYAAPGLVSPLLNYSQIARGVPVDSTSPCPPILRLDTLICDEQAELSWFYLDTLCSSDVEYFRVLRRDNDADDFVELDQVNLGDSTYDHTFSGEMAGCYVVTAVDSNGNESVFSNEVCVDNCVRFEIPDIFTPNGDLTNDVLVPLDVNYIVSVNINIYNRWGNLVFEATDPDINWDGKNKNTGRASSPGVYFYRGTVEEKRINGTVTREVNGYFYLFYDTYGSDTN